MSAISASSVSVKTMADGTLRITCDVEPRDARAAFELFGAPGVPMALAALRTGQGINEPEETPPEPTQAPERPTKRIAQWLAMRCADAEFRRWLAVKNAEPGGTMDAARAAEVVRAWCNVKSRADIDGNPQAEALFERHIRRPWAGHKESA